MSTTYNPAPTHRSSLVGPLILLLLGVLFLVSNIRADFSVWRVLGQYWPFLLIVWGVARLIEYFIARMTSRPIACTLTAGEVMLAILICLIGSALPAATGGWHRLARIHPGLQVLGENFDFTAEAAREIPPNATVEINNLYGNVRVTGADGPAMKVSARKSIKAFNSSEAEQADKSTPLEILFEGNRVLIRTNQDRLSGDRRISTDLEIALPRSVALTLEARYGEIDVADVAGPVEVNGSRAGLRLHNVAKDVRINLRRSDWIRATQLKANVEISGKGGDVELADVAGTVTIQGEFSGNIKLSGLQKPVRYASSQTELSLQKLPGRLEMDLGSLSASDVIGPFKLTARSKDVRIENFSREMEITARRGDIELRTAKLPLGNIHAESRSGNIELELPANAKFALEANTTSGRVENEYGGSVRVEESGKSAGMRGGPGSGAQIRLSTDRGNITFKKLDNIQSL